MQSTLQASSHKLQLGNFCTNSEHLANEFLADLSTNACKLIQANFEC